MPTGSRLTKAATGRLNNNNKSNEKDEKLGNYIRHINKDKMKLKKRKLKFAAIFGVCWFALLVLLVDGILKFQTLVDYFGSYALVEISLLLLVILPTVAVYIFTKE